MASTSIETHKITLSLKTMVTVIASVVMIVASYFYAGERTNGKIDDTNKRIDNNSRLLESQQSLIISNRYKDSIEKDFIEFKINQLRDEIKSSK